MTHQVIISLASNQDAEKNLAEVQTYLGQILSDIHYTQQLWTVPVGHPNSKQLYLNQLATATTQMERLALEKAFKELERQMGRTQEERLKGVVRIDIDLLKYDEETHHQKDWQRPYVQQLIGEID